MPVIHGTNPLSRWWDSLSTGAKIVIVVVAFVAAATIIVNVYAFFSAGPAPHEGWP